MMVAIPRVAIVERDDEEVPSFEVFEERVGVAFPSDGLAQWAAEPVENGGSQKEAPDVFRLGLQYLFDQVIGDGPVVAGEGVDEATNVVARLHRKSRELERCDHAFGSGLERGGGAR